MERLRILVTVPKCHADVWRRFLTDRVLKEMHELGDVVYNELDRPYTPEELRDALVDIDVAVASWGTLRFDEEVLSKANRLKIIAYAAGSVASLVSDAIYEKGILLLSGNTVFAESVAECTLCYIMCSLRNLRHFFMTPERPWRTGDEDAEKGIMDRTIGIVGYGMISKYFLKMLEPFHVKKKIYSGHITEEEAAKYGATVATLDEIFETCDIISLHSGLNEKTYHMIQEKHLKKMQDGALLVNTARGAIVDEEALIRELQTGRIYAALDVFETEPLPADSPLLTMENVICLPHIGGPTVDRGEYVTLKLIDEIKKWQNGETEFECEIKKSYAANMTKEGYKPPQN
ncbi:MAG: hydroxyacid dehydrogenase [Clostridia bacterium]|nr:hydroxyacid dehydrogenase [Clostridia bacterium]